MNNISSAQNSQSGWLAELELDYAVRREKTCLVRKKQRGPLTLQRPFYPENDTCHSYLLHPPGGVVGGDTLDIKVRAETGSHCLITTPGATKFYRSKTDLVSTQIAKNIGLRRCDCRMATTAKYIFPRGSIEFEHAD